MARYGGRREVGEIHRQTIRTFYEVKDGVVRILHTDPMLHPKVGQTVGEEVAHGIPKTIYAAPGTVRNGASKGISV